MSESIVNKLKLNFSARFVSSGQAPALEVNVKNDDAAQTGPLLIEFNLFARLVAKEVRDAAKKAGTKEEPVRELRGLEPLGGIVNAPEGWSVWAVSYADESVVVLRILNDTSQKTGKTLTPTKFDAGATLTLRIPLAQGADAEAFTLSYGYNHTRKKETRFDGSLDLLPAGLGDWEPKVSLTVSHKSPTMIAAGDKVSIKWAIENGVSATLRGPLSGGNNEQALSLDRDSNFWMEEGFIKIMAVGAATYVLDAVVKGHANGPNVQVVRTIHIDIFSADKYSNLVVRPSPVLPNDMVEIDWAVWGVQKATLNVVGRDSLVLELTQQNLSRAYQGTGVYRIYSEDLTEETVTLVVDTGDPKHKSNQKESINATRWKRYDKPAPVFTGRPRGLAVTQGVLALLTTDGLWTAPVGVTGAAQPVFSRVQAGGKAWHALAAFGREFVVLRHTPDDYFVLERYDPKGQRIKSPITLPEDFQTLARRGLTSFDLVGFNERVYVVAAGHAPGRWARLAYSVRFEPDDKVSEEPMLSRLNGYLMLSFDGALYAYQRRSGRMLRFDPKTGGGLEAPRRAASAVTNEGKSMFRSGLPISVGNVLVVLDPAAPPSLEFEPQMGVFGTALNAHVKPLRPPKQPNEIPRDFVYNPQKDVWATCGHGLQLEPGAVAAFRGGSSPRLWVIQEGETHTLTGAEEELFARDFVNNDPSKELPPALDATRAFTLANESGFDLAPVDDVCRAAGVDGLSTDGVAELLTPLAPIPNMRRMEIKLSYSLTDTKEVKLRLIAAKARGLRYLLEVTLSGDRLGSVTTVFKRLAADGRLDDVPDTLQQYNVTQITVRPPAALHAKRSFLILNGTPQELGVSPAVGVDKVQEHAVVELNYTTPDFKIFVTGAEKAGHLWVTLDYAMPPGIELSPRAETQRKLIRVVTDDARLLDLSAEHHAFGKFLYEKFDGSKYNLPLRGEADWCRVGVRKKFELDGVRLGDAASYKNTPAIYFPMAKPDDTSKPGVYRFEDGNVTSTSNFGVLTKGGALSRPNAVALNEQHVNAVFAEPTLHHWSHNLTIPWPRVLENVLQGYKEIIALGAGGRDAYMLGRKESGYFFVAEQYPNNVWEMKLELASIQPSVGAWLAVSPDGKWAALCQLAGLLVIDTTSRKVERLNLLNTNHPAHVVFSHDGQWVYCAHATRVAAANPRRIVSGRFLSVTRVRVGNLNERQTVVLPNVESNFGLTVNTQPLGQLVKDDFALSLAPSPDGQSLFVSAGTKIMRIGLPDFKLLSWSATVELPCRLACVKEDWKNTWTVYALGSSYKGDGAKVDEFKTHLYTVLAPRN